MSKPILYAKPMTPEDCAIWARLQMGGLDVDRRSAAMTARVTASYEVRPFEHAQRIQDRAEGYVESACRRLLDELQQEARELPLPIVDGVTYLNGWGDAVRVAGACKKPHDDKVWSIAGNWYERETGRFCYYGGDGIYDTFASALGNLVTTLVVPE